MLSPPTPGHAGEATTKMPNTTPPQYERPSAARPSANASARRIVAAGHRLLQVLEQGRKLDRDTLKGALTAAFGGGALDGPDGWTWKTAYEAAEAAVVMFVLRYAKALQLHDGPTARSLAALTAVAALEPPQTRRDEEQVRRQQFSSPLEIAFAVARAAALRPADRVLEPSAGTGMLAAMAATRVDRQAGGALTLNELAETRSGVLALLFPDAHLTRHDAEQLGDRTGAAADIVLMNPPFSRTAAVARTRRDADLRHVMAAYRTLRPHGRLVAITSAGCRPGSTEWNALAARQQVNPEIALTVEIAGRVYQRHGTNYETRLTVLDAPPSTIYHRGNNRARPGRAETAAELLEVVTGLTPPRYRAAEPITETVGGSTAAAAEGPAAGAPAPPKAKPRRNRRDEPPSSERARRWNDAVPLAYEAGRPTGVETRDDRPYHPWTPCAVVVDGAKAHPTMLVESAAMAAVPHRRPSARPLVPRWIVDEGALSDAQLESVVLAADAHTHHLGGEYVIGDDWEHVRRVDGPDGRADDEQSDDPSVVYSAPTRIRQGWMCGDGTGCGKGRQVASVILDQWLRGRRRALWLSQSDKLIEDARRDWEALGGRPDDLIQLSRIRQKDDVGYARGILFCTYATLRSPGRNGNRPRLEQIVAWLAGDDSEQARHCFNGVIVFDEAHAMANAAGGTGPRGEIAPSRQGRAGLRLQNALPDARVVYVSATGASTVAGLAYAQRLGLWQSNRTPFEKRAAFIEAMDQGGVAAHEIVARDMKALGLYQARALSYEGIEIDILTHDLTAEQREIYDAYADAFKIIHRRLDAAMEAAHITESGETHNKAAKTAARSAFESAKQRFFGHLLTAMKCPTLLRAIEADIDAGHSAVVQLVSTGEALTERRLAEIPVDEWDDLRVDCTPREYVLEFLRNAFPVQLHEEYTDEDGRIFSRPVVDEHGKPVISLEAARMRDELIEELGALPPVGSALDQIVHHFGDRRVAEITGRARRIVTVTDENGERNALRTRPATANLAETRAFMAGEKHILVFSGAGNTGRSYHADLGCGNTDRRIHYLVEPGWRADQAIQGLGRTHRTHQKTAPIFRPVSTNVKGERRFISTIARRLDSLGAITRGQRDSQTSMGDRGKALFRPADNFESGYATTALRQFYLALHHRAIAGWTVQSFEEATGLRLSTATGLKDNLPPMNTFLNRLLALPIAEQNDLFEAVEIRIEANITAAVEAGTFAQGVERIRADSLTVSDREVACVHGDANADTVIVQIQRRDRIRPTTDDEALAMRTAELAMGRPAKLLVNGRSKRAAVSTVAPVHVLDNGAIEHRQRLIKPTTRETIGERALQTTRWEEVPERYWRNCWQREIAQTDPFRESRLWLVTGLLLPIWDRLDERNLCIYRLTTDDGEHLIGRVLTAAAIGQFRASLGLNSDHGPRLSAAELFDETKRRGITIALANGWRIDGRRHMGDMRTELHGPNRDSVALLRRLGCRTELVGYRTRWFVPSPEVLDRVLERFPAAGTTAK